MTPEASEENGERNDVIMISNSSDQSGRSVLSFVDLGYPASRALQ